MLKSTYKAGCVLFQHLLLLNVHLKRYKYSELKTFSVDAEEHKTY